MLVTNMLDKRNNFRKDEWIEFINLLYAKRCITLSQLKYIQLISGCKEGKATMVKPQAVATSLVNLIKKGGR